MRAKMRCDAITENRQGAEGTPSEKYAETVMLSPVYGVDGSANAEWSKATPSGSLTMTITNPEAWGKLKAGAFYFVDLTEAPAEG